VEDQGGAPTLQEIRRRFGDNVASTVEGCTDTDQQPKPPWLERKRAYIDHVRNASPSVCLVSACDKLHNARCILSDVRVHEDAAFNRFTGGREGTLWYYRSLADSFRNRTPLQLASELERVVSELERMSPPPVTDYPGQQVEEAKLMTAKYGFEIEDWDKAKAEMKTLLVQRARLRGMMPYSDLVRKVTAISLEPNSPALSTMLGEISAEEDDAGRGLLTVIVVHKDGDMQPGPGFFELAKQRGRNTGDILKCWIEELKKVHATWSQRPGPAA
jgi:hypothetical protein